MIEIEEFRDIPGYEGMYEVSNLGRIRRNGKILKPSKSNWGYLKLVLFKNGTRKTVLVHRLVAYAFIPNPQNLPQINHKDEDKTNNSVDNLEWCDNKYNANYSHSKPVLQYDKTGNFIREWPSARKVEEETGIYNSNISQCCLGKRYKTVGGFVWKYKN